MRITIETPDWSRKCINYNCKRQGDALVRSGEFSIDHPDAYMMVCNNCLAKPEWRNAPVVLRRPRVSLVKNCAQPECEEEGTGFISTPAGNRYFCLHHGGLMAKAFPVYKWVGAEVRNVTKAWKTFYFLARKG